MSFTGVTPNVFPHNSYSNIVGKTMIFSSSQAPANEAITAVIPKRNNTALSAFLPTNVILKRLLEKCTTPVNAMAISMGKNNAKTGARMVPSPKPEKTV